MEHNAQVFLALSISGALCFIAWRWARYRAARLREVTKHASSRDAEQKRLDSAAHVPMANQHTDLCNRDVNDLPTVQSNRAPQPIVSLDLRSFGTATPFASRQRIKSSIPMV